ncbi:MAG: cation:proton antiporter [Deltaproteobacteria bacterium]|nr:cation:proton antiporter [Deltaproteobacteria bacterium]
MNESAETMITLGVLFLLGLATDMLGRRTRLPRVTLLLIFGFVIGPSGFKYLMPEEQLWFPFITNMALVMVGFLLGEKMTQANMRLFGRLVFWFSLSVVTATTLLVLGGLLLMGVRTEIALLLAGIATATAPAATTDVIHEMRAEGPFSSTLLGIVALDDAWGLIVFSLTLTAVQVISGQGDSLSPLLMGAWELGGAVLVGVALGVPMAFLTGRIKPGEPTLIEALGLVLLCGGVALRLEVSFLLASMCLGTVVANLASHHMRPFHAIEDIEWPFMVLFFMFGGASLHTAALSQIGLIWAGYIVLRILGRVAGSLIGGIFSKAESNFTRWMGMALMPQAGVALGMALMVAQRRPDLGEIILPIIVAATIFFELTGPVLTRTALLRAGEARLETE